MSPRPCLVASLSFPLLVVAVVVGLSAAAEAGEPSLQIGDEAPALEIEQWVHGTAVEGIEPGEIYVVELWATWCGPCRQSMPHLEQLQTDLASEGVHIIGVTSEPADVVEAFFDDEGSRPGYAIASDTDASVNAGWLEASGESGIPTAFIVGRTGRIEWIGHPMKMGTVLSAVAEDRFDREAYARWHASHQEREARVRELSAEGKWEAVVGHLDALIAAHREDEALYGRATEHEIERLRALLRHGKELEVAWRDASALVEAHWDHANTLNEIAWLIATEPELASRDLELALTASVRSNLLAHSANAAYLDTLARVYFEQGELVTAVRYQRDAIEALGGKPHAEIEGALEHYLREAEARGTALPEPTPPPTPPPTRKPKLQHI